jgi:hypothetical protein
LLVEVICFFEEAMSLFLEVNNLLEEALNLNDEVSSLIGATYFVISDVTTQKEL